MRALARAPSPTLEAVAAACGPSRSSLCVEAAVYHGLAREASEPELESAEAEVAALSPSRSSLCCTVTPTSPAVYHWLLSLVSWRAEDDNEPWEEDPRPRQLSPAASPSCQAVSGARSEAATAAKSRALIKAVPIPLVSLKLPRIPCLTLLPTTLSLRDPFLAPKAMPLWFLCAPAPSWAPRP